MDFFFFFFFEFRIARARSRIVCHSSQLTKRTLITINTSSLLKGRPIVDALMTHKKKVSSKLKKSC